MKNAGKGRGGGGRAAAWALSTLLALALVPASAFAHAKLSRSEPKSNVTLNEPPRLVELWFTAELEPGFNTIEVKDAAGRRVDRGEVTLAEGGKKAQAELGELAAGAYKVVWKVLSTDEHTIRGSFTFKVAAAASASAVATETPPQPPGAGRDEIGGEGRPDAAGAREGGSAVTAATGESTITWLDNAVRWLAYLAMMALFGGFASRLLVLGPALRQVRGADEARAEEATASAARRTTLLLRAGVAALVPALLLSLVLQSASVHGVGFGAALSPALLGGVITRTGYGTAWLISALATAAVAVIIFSLDRSVKLSSPGGRSGLWWAGLAASAVVFVGPSLTGHAMAAARQHHFAVVSDWLHLVAGGFWVGGLFHLALTLRPALSKLARGQRTLALGRVIKLFTRVAIPSVAVVFLAGLYNSWIHVGSFGALWGTPYGRTLLVKLLLILPMLLLGAVNGFRFGPRAERLAAGEDEDAQRAVGRGFARSVRLEAALGVLVLLAAAVLVFLTPGRNDAMEMGGGDGPVQQQEGRVGR